MIIKSTIGSKNIQGFWLVYSRVEICAFQIGSSFVFVFLLFMDTSMNLIQVENAGTTPASEIVLAFPPAQADHLALVKAQAAIGKKKKKSYVHLDANPTELPDAPNGTKYFSISLLNPLSSGETATLEVLYILTHSHVSIFPSRDKPIRITISIFP